MLTICAPALLGFLILPIQGPARAPVTAVPAEDTIAAYVEAWSEPDPVKRDALLELSWAEDGVYQDPDSRYEGRAALAAGISDFFAGSPGAVILLASAIDVHHDRFRFLWELVEEDGSVSATGMDFGKLDADGRIVELVGFFGPFPEL